MNGGERRTSLASGFKNPSQLEEKVTPEEYVKSLGRLTCAKPCPVGRATILHILHKDGVHGLQSVPGGGSWWASARLAGVAAEGHTHAQLYI